tara:strand:- start:130 stop:231 length:102 start_codon:yes stop_codon:yes gene_type:complete
MPRMGLRTEARVVMSSPEEMDCVVGAEAKKYDR